MRIFDHYNALIILSSFWTKRFWTTHTHTHTRARAEPDSMKLTTKGQPTQTESQGD